MTIQKIHLDSLTPSPLHRRRAWGNLDELAASMREHGQLEPGIAREIDGQLELLVGNRRLRAAKIAGLDELVVDVREVADDLEALAIMVIENGQREDAHPLDEAELYEQMHARGMAVQDIAAQVGRAKSYVYGRLQLTKLEPAAKKSFAEGQWTLGAALLVARLPEAQQVAATKAIYSRPGDPTTAVEAAGVIRRSVALRLAGAPFRLDVVGLGGKPACSTCPSNSAAQRALFGDDILPGDEAYCLDPKCFTAKREADWQARVEAAKGSGQKVLTAEEAKKVFVSNAGAESTKGYVRLDQAAKEDPKKRTYGTLLGSKVTTVLAQDPRTGATVELVPVATANKVLRETHHLAPAKLPATRPAVEDAEAALGEAVNRRVAAALVDSVENAKSDAPIWRELAVRMIDQASEDIFVRRGWVNEDGNSLSTEEALERIQTMQTRELRGLVWEIALEPDIYLGGWRAKNDSAIAARAALCKAHGVDAAAIEVATKNDLAPKKEPEKKPAKASKKPAAKKGAKK